MGSVIIIKWLIWVLQELMNTVKKKYWQNWKKRFFLALVKILCEPHHSWHTMIWNKNTLHMLWVTRFIALYYFTLNLFNLFNVITYILSQFLQSCLVFLLCILKASNLRSDCHQQALSQLRIYKTIGNNYLPKSSF